MKSCLLVRELQYFLGARAHNNCVFARVCCGGERVDGMRQRCVSANPYKREEHNLAYKIGGGRSKYLVATPVTTVVVQCIFFCMRI